MNLPRIASVLGGLLLAAAVGCGDRRPGAVQTPPPVVVVATPVERNITDFDIFTARTQATQSVDIKPRVTGYLVDIGFKDGDMVKKDQVLFKIDDRPYKAQLDAAKADLEFRKAALITAQATYDIGLRVQKQDKTAISEQELTKRLGSRDEAAAGVDQAKAALEKAQLYYDWCKVLSPLDGRANRHFIDIGNLITQDMSTLTNIVSLKPTWAYFDVDENTAQRYQSLVDKGEVPSARKTEIPVEMARGNEDYNIKGHIDFLSNQLDPNTGSIRLRAVFPNEDNKLLAGEFGRIRVPSSAPHKALLVVDAAIGTDQDQRYVLVLDDNNVVQARRFVDVGQLHDGLREVMRYRTETITQTDGSEKKKKVEVLKATDRIIVEGLQRVRAGTKVEPRLVDMTTLMEVQPGSKTPTTAPKK